MNKIKVLGRNVVVSLSVLLVIFALGLGISKVYSTTNEVKSIDELLVPYQEVLDEINAELGCTLVIPDDVKESVYNAYKDLTVEDFRERIRQEYLEAMGDLGGDAHVICSIPDNTIISVVDISVSDWKDGNNADGAETTFGEQPNYHIVNIVDRTKTEGLPYATAEEKFFEDGDNEYYFSGMYSHYVIVHYEDGSQEDIVTALNAGRATIADLDKFEVDYFVRALDAENVEPLSEQ